MIEIPEVVVLADQINESMAGKRIKGIKIPRSLGRFSFYLGDPNDYDTLMRDSYICGGRAIGGMVEIMADDKRIVFSDGAIPRLFDRNEEPNRKSQLTIEFSDGSFLCVGIQLYGGLWCFSQGGFDNIYYSVAQEKPSPLHSDFDESYYLRLFETEKSEKLSLKAFLATEQRIPGLGNGTLQDILWTAELHPKAKVGSLSSDDRQRLLNSIKNVLKNMADNDGRETERDLFGKAGEYTTKIGRTTYGEPCPRCGRNIERQDYLGARSTSVLNVKGYNAYTSRWLER